MTFSKMMKHERMLVLILAAILDLANGLYLSQSSVNAEPGKSLAISCRDPGGQQVTWKGPKGPLHAHTRPKIQDTSIGKLLIFTPTSVHDTGNYTCSLLNNKNEFKVFALVVEDHKDTTFETDTSTNDYSNTNTRPHRGRDHENSPDSDPDPIYFKDTPEVQRGKEGDNVTIRCEINKPLKLNWLLEDEGENLGPRYKPIGDGLLIISASRTEDNRVFICEVVKSNTGKVIHKKIRFIVEHKPITVTYPYNTDTGEPPVWAQNDEVYGFQGENVNLTCEVEAEPPPTFEWRSSNQGHKKIGRVIKEGTHKSILQLKMSEETVDKYQCIASNKHGKLKKFFDLQIGVRPDPPRNIQLVSAGSDNIELKIEKPEENEEAIDNGMDPRWMNVFYRNVNSEDWDEQIFNITLETFNLTELNSSTMYEIMAATRNVAGLSALTNNTFIETKNAGSVQIDNLSFLSVVMVNSLILLTSKLA
ncbi:unnamed protein product [Phyllotreta striolata]|uniref:Uncharacterized protein n=1 Tax=Phyllotreta striolata TaxID=444603 RepID=A0A9N9TTQ9_PHYSR|nr:unnamed protein product [Phyllotreta striolata]